MNKTLVAVVVLAIIALGGAYFLSTASPAPAQTGVT